ncbi:MAG: WXG100 family type VII secretion target [Oscillospiraceae bacterium]|nr:WXG100 family type VII secretion target [Oscillospiraceae bacterium]
MKFVVDPPELHKASQALSNLSEEYIIVYSRLMTTASTMGEAWKATDNLAFVDQIKGFCEELKAMADHLLQAGTALEQQATNYETTRDNNITGVKQLTN